MTRLSTLLFLVSLALPSCAGVLSGGRRSEGSSTPDTSAGLAPDLGGNGPGAPDLSQADLLGEEKAEAAAQPPAPDAGSKDQAGPTLTWQQANLTEFTSYPDPGSEECIKYNGCKWAGQFAALQGTQPESWVKTHNIGAVHSKDFSTYKLKTLRLKQGSKTIDVTIYDMCADSDCSGCCTANSKQTGFLIDIESYTAARFGTSSGIVDWACLDC
jgi:hypothetical protein